jgi:Rv0623-like transcription factor
MAEPQLSVRSARARDLAHKLAHQERRTVAQVVERALELYDRHENKRESMADFLERLRKMAGPDVDLEAVIQAGRKPHDGIDL